MKSKWKTQTVKQGLYKMWLYVLFFGENLKLQRDWTIEDKQYSYMQILKITKHWIKQVQIYLVY